MGAGFAASIFGKKALVTNCHVLLGNTKVKIYTQDGAKLDVKSMSMARDRDIILIESDGLNDLPALNVEDDAAAIKIGASVKVCGNKDGDGGHSESPGTVKGIGPKFFEIAADVIPGQSGGPIINLSNGKVASVTTFKTLSLSKGKIVERTFGARIDNTGP